MAFHSALACGRLVPASRLWLSQASGHPWPPHGRCSTKCASATAAMSWSEAEGVICTLSPAGTILQAGLLAVIFVFCIHDDLALIKVRNISKSQELMIFHFLTRYWSHWCTTKISLPLVNWMEIHCPPPLVHIPYSPHTVGKVQSSGNILITSDTMVHFDSVPDHSYSLKCPSDSNLMYWVDLALGSAMLLSVFPGCVDGTKILRLPFVKTMKTAKRKAWQGGVQKNPAAKEGPYKAFGDRRTMARTADPSE
uniref:Uncharacterized protein n=1 Tax=Oryza barthii TaxID=65489 RepID=A0A0D3FTZ8_9ORYZ